jgi:hypothetical protein
MPSPFKNTLIGSTPKLSPALPARDFGKRSDGTPKGSGWLGVIDLGDGNVATEYTTQSDAVKINGKRVDFPTLVPTLTPDEIQAMKDVILAKKEVPETIMRKAIDHAKKQLGEGKSVFKQPETMADQFNKAIQLKPSYKK